MTADPTTSDEPSTDPVDLDAFWTRVAPVLGMDRAARPPAFSFGDSPELADSLVDLVVSGRKRATAMLLAEHEICGDPLPEEGGVWIVLDGAGAPRAVIRTCQVRIGPFQSVDADFAWDEGEGDRTVTDWLDGHRRYFCRVCAERLGQPFAEDMTTVFERFEVLYPTGAGSP